MSENHVIFKDSDTADFCKRVLLRFQDKEIQMETQKDTFTSIRCHSGLL